MKSCLKQDGTRSCFCTQKFRRLCNRFLYFRYGFLSAFNQRNRFYADPDMSLIAAKDFHLFLRYRCCASRGNQYCLACFICLRRNIGFFHTNQASVICQLGSKRPRIHTHNIPAKRNTCLSNILYIFQGDCVYYDHFASFFTLFF